MSAPKLDVHEVDADELRAVLAELEGKVAPRHFELISRMVATLVWLFQLLEKEGVTMRILRRAFLGRARSSERTEDVLGKQGSEEETASDESPSEGQEEDKDDQPREADEEEEEEEDQQQQEQENREQEKQEPEQKEKRKGHGRNGVDKYPGAERVPIPHRELKHGDSCPSCGKGAVYAQKTPGNILRIKGRSLLEAKVYQPERLRCGLCGEVHTAELPSEAGDEIYDESAGSIIALMKYGSGMPFYRMGKLQEGFGVPLPASTQWDIVKEVSQRVEAAYHFLIYLAAQGEVFYNDDTGMTILELKPDPDLPPDRTGIFTSGVVVQAGEHTISLFFTGRRHAGERLNEVLQKRDSNLPTPIQMSDAVSRNVPQDAATQQANCNSHGRRNFVKIADHFPEDCRRILEDFRAVYRNDAETKKQQMNPEERLRYHQEHSGPVLEALKEWMEEQLEGRRVEPNSALGNAMNYLQNHWEKLTLFLRVPGAPLDNNICERALKKAILHRKNALFYKTENGARVGDLFMSLVHTCRLNDANPFDYLTELQKHKVEVQASPQNWMPWNYRAALESLASSSTHPLPT